MNKKIHSLALLVNLGIYGVALPAMADDNTASAQHEDTMVITAAEQNLQAPGVSTITADEIRKNPPARDVAEIIRTMPGVNLTGNSTSGQRGNNRQIDIRGMGPENTLILIDGKPVTSRNSIRLGWRGERDTRGDTGWVPPEMIERIEVIRGPAAARYGNGAAGGVVNIITRKIGNSWRASAKTDLVMQENREAGDSRLVSVSASGRWAGSLQDDIGNLLLATLATHLHSSDLALYPDRIGFSAQAQIILNISRLDSGPQQAAVLEARWRLLDARGQQRAGDLLQLREEHDGSLEGQVAAQGRLVERLGQRLAEAVQKLPAGG